jgi:type IVB pilus formation R64 PilN family outer membrane protein
MSHSNTFRIGASLRQTGLCIAVAMSLAGCGTMQHVNKEAMDGYNASKSTIKDVDAVSPALADKQRSESEMMDVPYVNTKPITYVQNKPSAFKNPAQLNAPQQEVWQLFQNLSVVTGLKIRADDDLLNVGAGPVGSLGSSAASRLPPPPQNTVDSTLIGGGVTSSMPSGDHPRAQIGAISYNGTREGLFNHIAGMLDATWSYDERSNTVHFYRYEVRTFHIDDLPGEQSTTLGMDSQDGTDVQASTGQTTHASGAEEHIEQMDKSTFWDRLEKSLGTMRSSNGQIVVEEKLSQVTVRDRWDHVSQMASYIDGINNGFDAEVAVKVTVYRVTDNDSDNRGLNWNILYNTLGQVADKVGASIATPQPTGDGLSSLVLSAPTKTATGSTALFSGSQFFLNALSSIGKTSVVTTATIPTTSNVAASTKDETMTTYLAQTTSLLTSGVSGGTSSAVGAGATLTPGSVETGFSMTVLPSVQPDGHRLLLEATISLSTLDQMNTYSSGGDSIQEPQVSVRKFMPRKWLKSGETLVIAGFDSDDAAKTTATPLSESTWMLGGNRDVSRQHDMVVIAITPIVSSPQIML